jgi:hypothetical protein
LRGCSSTSNPSFNSSPWMRGAPHSGLSWLICPDQMTQLSVDSGPPWLAARLPAPVGPKPRPMPP